MSLTTDYTANASAFIATAPKRFNWIWGCADWIEVYVLFSC